MAYKARFMPIEVLRAGGWMVLSRRERDAAAAIPPASGAEGVPKAPLLPMKLGR